MVSQSPNDAPPPAAARRQVEPGRSNRIALFGMSGVGKSWIGHRLREAGWFHYSVDYRIGTRYLGEHIVDDFKREAMKSPMLRDMLRSDSIYIASNITFDNLRPLSTFLGKPGCKEKGGLDFEDYVERQRLHRTAEIAAMRDSRAFIDKAREIYGYDHFLCDTSGSLVEVVDPFDPNDPILADLSQDMVFVLIESEPEDDAELIRRFVADPKPIYYNEAFLRALWAQYLESFRAKPDTVDPDDFSRWAFERLVARRRSGYLAIAQNWGVRIPRREIVALAAATPDAPLDPAEFERRLIGRIAEAQAAGPGGAAMTKEAATS